MKNQQREEQLDRMKKEIMSRAKKQIDATTEITELTKEFKETIDKMTIAILKGVAEGHILQRREIEENEGDVEIYKSVIETLMENGAINYRGKITRIGKNILKEASKK